MLPPPKDLFGTAPWRCHDSVGRGVHPARDRGQQIFNDALAEFAAQARNPAVTALEARLRTPVRVAVVGRCGVGRGAVAAAIAGAGVTVVADAGCADIEVRVVAEVLKPEERAALRALRDASVATLVVLNKADLTGADGGGPLRSAERRAAAIATTVGLRVVPMVAHLADAHLDDDEMAALGVLAVSPVDMTSTDAVVRSQHPLPADLRARLLEKLDRFGIAQSILAVADGQAGPAVVRQLRACSRIDRVLECLEAVAAPVRYRRLHGALHELRTLAAQSGDDELDAFLTGDEVVIAVMAAAVDVVQASGLDVDRGDDAEAHARRAVRFQAYARGPVEVMHHRCATDIVRGSLRLLGRVR